MTKEFCESVDETVLRAAKRILDLPELLEPQNRGGWGLWKLEQRRHAARLGGMIAASAPTKEQSDAELEDLFKEHDVSAVFDVEAFDTLRRTPIDWTLGGLTGAQSRVKRVVSAAATRSHHEACEPNACAW